MSKEYIEREALIEELKRRDFLPVIVKHAIEAVPAADVAPVVRCKDCRYFKMYKCRMEYSSHDDFCSYGERKDGNNDT